MDTKYTTQKTVSFKAVNLKKVQKCISRSGGIAEVATKLKLDRLDVLKMYVGINIVDENTLNQIIAVRFDDVSTEELVEVLRHRGWISVTLSCL